MSAKHSLEDLRQHGRALFQPYAAEQAHNRELREKSAEADRDVVSKEQRKAAAEELSADRKARENAKASDPGGFRQGVFGRRAGGGGAGAQARRYAEWCRGQVAESDARLAELAVQAADYVCREVSRPESAAAAKQIDDALETLVTALAREEEVRQVTARAIRVEGKPHSPERMGRHLRALTLATIGDLSDIRHAVECWRKEAYLGGYRQCRPPRRLPREPWRPIVKVHE